MPDDKDLGLDAVSWRRFADGRGGDLHVLAQCATGGDWKEKLSDLDLKVWAPHIHWAVEPIRVFATPRVLRLPNERWIRATRQGGLILDRPRLLELSVGTRLPPTLLREVRTRIREYAYH